MQAECLKDEELWEHYDGLDLEFDAVGERLSVFSILVFI